MKFCAPQNNWDMKGGGWWPLAGSTETASGVRVSQETALTFSAVFAATRVISETMASLPLSIMAQVDDRTTRKAVDHPLYPLLHDLPTKEQDIASWLDMQVQFQLNWGNAFAEKQRDSTGRLVSLLPIHPSRLPACNIKRNPTDPRYLNQIVAGRPGEWVYYVRNDSGSTTPIPASDMLHVPGVLSDDGLNGRSIIVVGAESIGIAVATDRHAGAFFRNGAVSNVALTSDKIVGKETADRLRESWQRTYAGVHNHYKALLLEDGIKPFPFSIAPEASQLIEARQLGYRDVARIYRVPPHMIGDLSRATWSNIESEEMSFVVHTMLPWIVRWEKAMYRQLLSDEERRKYRFKFNVMGLLRGDSAARGAFYQVLFNMGAASPNDIREREDMNPIAGGDQYFVPANNLVPLDKIAELAQAQIDKLNEPAPQPVPPQESETDEEVEDVRYAEVLAMIEARDTLEVERLAVRQQKATETEESLRTALRSAIESTVTGFMEYERRAAKQAANKPETFLTWQDEFYGEFRAKLSSALSVFNEPADQLGFAFDSDAIAGDYVSDSVGRLTPLADLPCDQLKTHAELAVSEWSDRPARLSSRLVPKRSEPCAA